MNRSMRSIEVLYEEDRTLQKKASIMKRRNRKLECNFSWLDARALSGEPAASEASEQKNPNRFRTGKVRTHRWLIGD